MIDILIIGDEAACGELGSVLESLQLPVSHASAKTERAFLAYFNATEPDLLIAMETSDGFSGLDASRIMKNMAREKPIIFISDKEDDTQALQYSEAGASHYLSKNNTFKLRKAIEEAVTERSVINDMYNRIFDNHGTAFLVVARDDYRIMAANKAAAALLGYDKTSLWGRNLMTLWPRRDIGTWIEAGLEDVSPDGNKDELTLVTQNEKTVYISHIGDSFETGLGTGKIMTICEAIPKEAVVLAKTNDMRWLDEITPMLRPLVHYFQNSYTVIRGYCDILRNSEGIGRDEGVYLSKLNDITEKDVWLLARLGDICVEDIDNKIVRVDVNEVIGHVTQAMRASIGHESPLAILEELDDRLPVMNGREKSIQDLVTCLGRNAMEACELGGSVTFITDHTDANIFIIVRDTGRGMDPELQKNCVKPFVTTKSERGAGLGLSVAMGIVRRNGGHMSIASEPNKGTTVRVRIPVA